MGAYIDYDELVCRRCYFNCMFCDGQGYDECTECMPDRGNRQELPIKGICECKNEKDDLPNGDCAGDSSIQPVATTAFIIILGTVSIGLIIGVVNKKLFLLVKFVDLCQ